MTNYTDDGQPIEQGQGDGSLGGTESEKDKNIETPTAKSEESAETTFHAKEADNTEKFDRFWKYNNDIAVVRTSSQVFEGQDTRQERDKRYVIDSLNSELEVSDTIKEQAIAIALSADGRRFNKVGGLEALCLGAIVLAQNRWWHDQYQDAIQYDNADFEKIRSNRIQEWTDSDGNKIVSQLADKFSVDLTQTLKFLKSALSGE
jgi:hypothetical protein